MLSYFIIINCVTFNFVMFNFQDSQDIKRQENDLEYNNRTFSKRYHRSERFRVNMRTPTIELSTCVYDLIFMNNNSYI